ncbi:MAG TPA: transketolase [Polyangiaceae bacterium]|nr:transketolase [Polyangiaceae bacterium]
MTEPIDLAVRAVRFLSIDAVEAANSGHPGAPMGLAQIGVELFANYLRYDPEDPSWPNRDRFVLSCGHASALLYSLLHMAGYAVSIDDLKQFRQWGSRTPGHPEVGMTPGVETTTGPLGQGVGNAVGLALAGKMMAARVNEPSNPLIDYRVYAIASDGDLMEGVAREAISVAGHLGLDNLVLFWDDNHTTIDGTTEITFTENMRLSFEAAGWHVTSADGHDAASIRRALDECLAQKGKPCMIAARTHIGFGSPNRQDKSSCHGSPLGKAETELTKKAADWSLEPFQVPAAAYEPFRARAAQNKKLRAAWEQQLTKLSDAKRKLWNDHVQRTITAADLLPHLAGVVGDKSDSTRKLCGVVQQKVAELLPALVGGSADLNCSTLTRLAASTDVTKGDYSGRNINFGIREHGMGSILNGMALSGFFVPFGSTFLIFSDYCRPAIRLASLMERQVVYVFTHDTVYLGEDGPTHQPVEQLATLRLIPGLTLFRPADGLESAAAWAYAATHHDGPTIVVGSRQSLPKLARPAGFDPLQILKGAYVLADSERPELVVIATGSEVHVALAAQQLLAAKGHRVRVVSAPAWDLFERLPEEEQERVLPKGVRRAVFEIGATACWKGVVGFEGLVIGRDDFGISAPWERIQKEFGYDAPQVAARIEKHFF